MARSKARFRSARDVAKALGTLPATKDPGFPVQIRQIVERLDNPEDVLTTILRNRRLSHSVRFSALYGLLLRLRREERIAEYAEVVRTHEKEFNAEPYFPTFLAIVSRLRGSDPASLRTAVEYSRQAARRMPDVAGVVHQVAAFAAEYLELLDRPDDSRLLEEAEHFVEHAITLSHGSVGHYFETKARILALRGSFSAARAAVGNAIELEPRTGRDYLRRVTQYQNTRIRIDLLAERARWERAQNDFGAQLGRFQVQQLELLGILAAVVAIVAAGSNIASQSGGAGGARIMATTGGTVVVVFSSFALMSGRKLWKVAISAVVGILLLFMGLASPSWLVHRP